MLSNRLKSATSSLQKSYKANSRIFWLRAIYLVCVAYLLVFWRAFWTPDLLFVMFLGLTTLYGRARKFLYQFGPFVVLLLAYDSLRSIVPFITHRVHFTEMIDIDTWIGGGVLPTAQLQQWFFHGSVQWYDYYFYLLYMCHFLTPLILGLILWHYRPQHYNRFVMAFLLLSYAGFLTYIVFPAAPPWMASEMGLIPQIHKISTDVWWSLGVHNFPTVYQKLSPNLVAAVPSLHAAYPTLISLFIGRTFGLKWGLISLVYPLSLWVGIVYMGEHYIIDAVIGVTYAVAAYIATMFLFRQYGHRVRRLQGRVKARYSRAVKPAPR